jgi:nucleoside-diphosphate-sugar epimerase
VADRSNTASPMATPPTTVVTGAGGWLGAALVHRLCADPSRQHLRLLAADTADAAAIRSRLAGAGVDTDRSSIVVGDVSRADTARRLLHGLTGEVDVLHAAGVIHPRRVRDFVAVNADGTRHVLEASMDAGVRRVVHVSSNSPFGTNPHPDDVFRAEEPYHPYLGYGRSKMQAELAVTDAVAAGLDAVIVRPPWFYGPFQPARQTTFFRMVRRAGWNGP